MSPVLRVGTRSSLLARTQAQTVADRLSARIGIPAKLVLIATEGDVNAGALAQIGGTGVFVTALRTALADGAVDVAVHSLKDLPTSRPDGISLAAVPPRENPADALCSRDGQALADLPKGALVGTGSPRRVAFLRRARPDLDVRPIRGNVDTRLGRVQDGDLDAVVLAAAGLHRLGRDDAVSDLLSDDVMLPAPAQGALAVECRLNDRHTSWYASALARLDDPAARAEVIAERSVLAALEAGCSAPVGARARVAGEQLSLMAAVVAPDGSRSVSDRIEGPASDAAKLGLALGQRLLDQGAAELMTAPS